MIGKQIFGVTIYWREEGVNFPYIYSGQVVVVVKKEKDGFVLNRIQYAIINESWRLVAEGVMSPQDVDKVHFIISCATSFIV